VTEAKPWEHTRCVCQECGFTWPVSALGEVEPEKSEDGTQGESKPKARGFLTDRRHEDSLKSSVVSPIC
jgi:hypothetical protein